MTNRHPYSNGATPPPTRGCGAAGARTLIFMATHLGFPISTDAGMVAAAAPSQREVRRPPGSKRGAASLPMKLWIGLEWLAGQSLEDLQQRILRRRNDGRQPSLAGTRLARHYARSFVIMQLVSFRSNDMLRAQLVSSWRRRRRTPRTSSRYT